MAGMNFNSLFSGSPTDDYGNPVINSTISNKPIPVFVTNAGVAADAAGTTVPTGKIWRIWYWCLRLEDNTTQQINIHNAAHAAIGLLAAGHYTSAGGTNFTSSCYTGGTVILTEGQHLNWAKASFSFWYTEHNA